MAGTPFQYVWSVTGPGVVFSVEDVSAGGQGYLGVDYTTGVDTRFPDGARLGPLINSVDCSGASGTAANTNGLIWVPKGALNATYGFIVATRGTKYAKIRDNDFSLQSDGTQAAQNAKGTGGLLTKNAAGTYELSLTNTTGIFEVISAMGDTNTDTISNNNNSFKFRYLGQGYPADTIFGVGVATGTPENKVYSNALTSTTTMDADAFALRATVSGEPIQFTAPPVFQGNVLFLATSNGPYYYDDQFQEFRPTFPELDTNSTYNCSVFSTWSLSAGIICSLYNGTRLVYEDGSGQSIGPDMNPYNTSPIQNPLTAFAPGARWGYAFFYDIVNDASYMCAVRPRLAGDVGNSPFSYFPLAKLAGKSVLSALSIGTADGVRTNPATVFGYDTDVAYIVQGRGDRDYDDSNYTYASSGILYLTKAQRDRTKLKNLEWVAFTTSGCTANQTVKLSITYTDNRLGVEVSEDIYSAVTTNGFHKFPIPQQITAWEFKPYFTLTTSSSSATPVVSDLIIGGTLLDISEVV